MPCPKGGFHRVEPSRATFRLLATGSKQENVMKKLLIILGAASALILAGCNQGGTSDQYGTSSGTANSSNSIHSSGVSSNNAATP
jgi:uncharacterized lipoprotein YajG